MICKKPFVQSNHAYGCGQCLPCRLNRRRLWTHRIILEALVHPASSFVTLTYAPENVPDKGSLNPVDLQKFLKRLRFNSVQKLRFFGVGEYGDLTQRPHYHLALFGLGKLDTPLVDQSWGLGYVYLGDLTLQSAQYVAGYVTKKMTAKDDPRLQGRYPEFARMSNRPGIGALSIQQVADALSNRHGWDEISTLGDVPHSLRHGGSVYPLGRYLRSKLRKAMNFEETGQSKEESIRQSNELLSMFKDYFNDAPLEAQTITQMIKEKSVQKIRNLEGRNRIYSSKKGLGL